MKRLALLVPALIAVFLNDAHAGTFDMAALQEKSISLAQAFNGQVGFCARLSMRLACVHGREAFPLQSVMKLLVATAVMDAVDHGRMRQDDPVTLHVSDLSMNVQPIAALVRKTGSYQTTIDDLLFRAVVDSDSAATDFLIARLGGVRAIQNGLERLGVKGIRIDRDERHLQTQTAGLDWRPEYVDLDVLKQALQARSDGQKRAAFMAYLADPRDRGSPEAMTAFLQQLASGKLVSKAAAAHLMTVLSQTRTFPTRLKAGLLPGWSIAHKTGTGGTLDGITSAANDVGVLTAPDGSRITVAVFVSRTAKSDVEQDALMASLARAVCESYHPDGSAH